MPATSKSVQKRQPSHCQPEFAPVQLVMRSVFVLRIVLCIGFTCLMGPGVSNVPAQAPDESTAESTAEHLDQLKNIREGLVDAGARPEQRRRWADMLLSYNSPQANALIIELLGFSENPDVQRALCGVIADRARRAPKHSTPVLCHRCLTCSGRRRKTCG